MTPVRLRVAVADPIPLSAPPVAPAPPVDAAPEPPAPAEAPPAVADAPPPTATDHTAAAPPVDVHVRRRMPALLRRPVEYVRAYLTASLDHQLGAAAAREVDLAGAAARLERLAEAQAARAESHAAHLAALARDEAQRSAALAEQLAETALRLEAVFPRLAELETRQGRLVRSLAEQERSAAAAAAADQIALARRGVAAGDHAVGRLDAILGVLGPRLDELEIKVRPLIEVDERSVAVRTADGYVLLPRSEPLFVAAVANATSGGLEPGVRRVLRALLRPGDACADVGANVGLLTAAMAFAVGAAGRVWAFEPEARVREQLARTLHHNGLAQVVLSGAAVGARAGRLTFHQSPVIGHSSLYALPPEEQAEARPVEVEVTTLDAAVPAGTALAAVKIDVEGAELDVLRGMGRVIADSPDLAVVAEFGPSHLRRVGIAPDAWFAAFAAHGLHPRRIGEPDGSTAPVDAEDLAQVESVNLVFVRPGGAADGRLPR